MKMGPNLIVNTVVMSMITMMIMITQMSISIIAASNNNSIAAANSTTTCWCSDLLYKPDFGCQNGSSSILLEYPNDAGIIQCSGAYTLKQTKPIPSLKVLTANASKLYTVIMVDTSDSEYVKKSMTLINIFVFLLFLHAEPKKIIQWEENKS